MRRWWMSDGGCVGCVSQVALALVLLLPFLFLFLCFGFEACFEPLLFVFMCAAAADGSAHTYLFFSF